MVMGCYGVGVSRLAQSAVEQSFDDKGIVWPVAIAPYHCVVVVPNIKDEQQMAAAEQIASGLSDLGIEVLLDDRNERAGVKFKDAELIGVPFRVTTGRSLKDGKVELNLRATGEKRDVALEEAVKTVHELVQASL